MVLTGKLEAESKANTFIVHELKSEQVLNLTKTNFLQKQLKIETKLLLKKIIGNHNH